VSSNISHSILIILFSILQCNRHVVTVKMTNNNCQSDYSHWKQQNNCKNNWGLNAMERKIKYISIKSKHILSILMTFMDVVFF